MDEQGTALLSSIVYQILGVRGEGESANNLQENFRTVGKQRALCRTRSQTWELTWFPCAGWIDPKCKNFTAHAEFRWADGTTVRRVVVALALG